MLLTQNSKLKKSGYFNFTLPALQSTTGLVTCPNADKCASGCYARMGTYRFSNVAKKHEANLQATLSDDFVPLMINEIQKIYSKNKNIKIRIHDAGDFYSAEYLEKWTLIITSLKEVEFYAYTKQVEMMLNAKLPNNFRVIFSLGGKQDNMIDTEKHFHSRVFESIEELTAAGYVDSSENDSVAATTANNKIGLVYHGAKNFSNTRWGKVA